MEIITLYVLILLAFTYASWQGGKLFAEWQRTKAEAADLDQRDKWADDYIARNGAA